LSEEEFWDLTPYEFELLMRRHRNDVQWQEVIAAVQPWVYANANRDPKKRRKPYQLDEFTITGLTKPRRRKVIRDPAAIFGHISTGLTALGGKSNVDDGR